MDKFEKGQQSILQALAMMRDDEDYGRKFGGIPDVLVNRRETSISMLCNMIARMKLEIDSKNKCAKMLEDISIWWKDFQTQRQQMSDKIRNLEKENNELKEKLKRVESRNERERVDSWSAEGDPDSNGNDADKDSSEMREEDSMEMEDNNNGNQFHGRKSTNSEMEHFHHRRSTSTITTTDSYLGNGNNNSSTRDHSREDNHGILDNQIKTNSLQHSRHFESSGVMAGDNNFEITDDFTPQNQSNVNFSLPLLTRNPYDSLDSSYYNPTQFFHRLSTTSARISRPKRGKVEGTSSAGRGKKKPDEVSSASTSKTSRGGRRKAHIEKRSRAKKCLELEPAEIINVSGSGDEMEMDQMANALNAGSKDNYETNEGGDEPTTEPLQDESPDKTFFDFTSTFLDETNFDRS